MEPDKENTNARRTSVTTTGTQGRNTASDTKPTLTSRIPAGVTRTSRPRANNRNVSAAQRGPKRRQAAKPVIQEARQDWRTNIYTTFFLGAAFAIGILEVLTNDWKMPAAFCLGLLYCFVMWRNVNHD